MNPPTRIQPLTPREKEVLQLIFDGNTSQEVAKLLSVGKRTVDFHLANAYQKLGAHNRMQAFKAAQARGLL